MDTECSPGVSAIVCAKNAELSLQACLGSLVSNRPDEIILVDGGSADRTIELATSRGCRVITDRGLGLAAARNLGVAAARYGHIFFLDSDAILGPNTLQMLFADLHKNGYAGDHAQIRAARMNSYWERAEDKHFSTFFNRAGPRESITTMAGLFHKSALLAFPFDPFFVGAAEDGDLSIRLGKARLTLGISEGVVYHFHKATLTAFIGQKLWYGRGTARLALRHRSFAIGTAPLALAVYAIGRDFIRGSVFMVPYWYFRTVALYGGFILELGSAPAWRRTRAPSWR